MLQFLEEDKITLWSPLPHPGLLWEQLSHPWGVDLEKGLASLGNEGKSGL